MSCLYNANHDMSRNNLLIQDCWVGIIMHASTCCRWCSILTTILNDNAMSENNHMLTNVRSWWFSYPGLPLHYCKGGTCTLLNYFSCLILFLGSSSACKLFLRFFNRCFHCVISAQKEHPESGIQCICCTSAFGRFRVWVHLRHRVTVCRDGCPW